VSAARSLIPIVVALVAGCETDPAEHVCPDLASGGLVITEVRGDQDPNDTLGEWIELYNASGTEQDLIGLHIRLRKIDGSADDRVIVRRSVVVAADAYVVIGLGLDAARPAYVDYAAGNDASDAMFPNGAIDVDGCADQADQLIYNNLPSTGTYSYGLVPPTADGNDVAANWCTSTAPEGTPGAPNDPSPCP